MLSDTRQDGISVDVGTAATLDAIRLSIRDTMFASVRGYDAFLTPGQALDVAAALICEAAAAIKDQLNM